MCDFIHVHAYYIIYIYQVVIYGYIHVCSNQCHNSSEFWDCSLLFSSLYENLSVSDFPLGLWPFIIPVAWIALCSSTWVSSGTHIHGDNLVSLMTQSSNYAQTPPDLLWTLPRVWGPWGLYVHQILMPLFFESGHCTYNKQLLWCTLSLVTQTWALSREPHKKTAPSISPCV